MKLYFCESCGKRVTDQDIAKGAARDKKLTGVFCADCATGVMTIETVPLDQAEANRILREAAQKAPASAEKLPSTASLPVAQKQSSPDTTPAERTRLPSTASLRPAAAKTRAPSHSEGASLAPFAIGAAALVIVVIGIALASSSGGNSPKAPKTVDHTPDPEVTVPAPEPRLPLQPEPPRPTAHRGPVTEPTVPTPTPAPAIAAPRPVTAESELVAAQQDLKTAGEQLAAGQLTLALRTLEASRKEHGEKAWWKNVSEAWVKAETAAREQLEQEKTAARAAQEEIAKLATAEELAAFIARWQPKTQSVEESIAAAAHELLQSAAARKVELEKAASAKLIEELGGILEKHEAALRVRSAENLLAATKAIAEVEQRTNDSRELIEQFAERIAALRFDIQTGPEDHSHIYRGARCTQKGPAVEVSWDFQTGDQVECFTPDDPSRSARIGWDEKNRALMLADRGEHSSVSGNTRRNTPYILMPFVFKPQAWSIQSDVTHLSSKRKAGSSGLVLLMEGGGTIRVGFNEQTGNKVKFTAICEPPIAGWEKQQNAEVSSTVEKTSRLVISYADGSISMSGTFGGKTVTLPGGKGPLAPIQIGVYTRSYQVDEDIAFLHDNFKVTGILDRDHLKELREQARNAAIAGAKAARLREFHQRQELAGTLGKDWMVLWTAKSHFKGCPARGDFNGRKDVVKGHPLDGNVAGKWLRRVNLEPGKKYALTYDTSANAGFDVATAVLVNGKLLLKKIIAGNQWQKIEVDLSEFAGSEFNLELTCETGNTYSSEYGYFDLVRIMEK